MGLQSPVVQLLVQHSFFNTSEGKAALRTRSSEKIFADSPHHWVSAWNLNVSASDPTLEKILEPGNGGKAIALAAELGILQGPVYPVGDASNYPDFLVQQLLRHMENLGPAKYPAPPTISVKPKRNPFLAQFFSTGFFRADWLSYHLGDKLLAGKLIAARLGGDSLKVMGVKELLTREGLVHPETGEWQASREELHSALKKNFPRGFVLKAAMAFGSKSGTFFHQEDVILDALHGPKAIAYQPEEFSAPFQPPAEFLPFAFSSGERFFLMEKVQGTALAGDSEEGRASEIRAHSVEGRCIADAIFARWDGKVNTDTMRPHVVQFVEHFLGRMPEGFRRQQVYAYDLFVPASGPIQILEINTNRGRVKLWSDYLRYPSVLAAHAKHLEQHYGWKFPGSDGEALLSGFSNVVNYVRGDFVYMLLDEDSGGKQRDFWQQEILKKNVSLMQKAMAFRADHDKHGCYTEIQSFGAAFLAATREKSWPELIEWARADLDASGFTE